MKLKDLSLAELECMGYDEIAYLILLESGKKQKLMDIFKKICKCLELDFESRADNIADLFELLSTNKKFIMLDNGYWDLQINHKTKIVVEDVEDDHVEIDEDLDDAPEETTEEDIYYEGEETDDTSDDDLANLVVVDEDESNLS